MAPRKEPGMTVNEYADKVVLDFMRNITDHVFLNIQSNEALMREYQTQVNENGLQTINQAIGRKVKDLFDLEDDGICSAPRSWLIKDFTLHSK
jgi:predicted metalloenzyme YecM